MGGGIRSGRVSFAGHGSKYNATLNDYIKGNQEEDKKEAFISFSMRDKYAVELLREQADNDKFDFEFDDTSLKRPVKNCSWRGPVGTKIKNSDAVILLIGKDTHGRPAVNWELNYAYKHDIPIIPVRIHRDKRHKIPHPIKREGDGIIDWNLDDIQYELNYAS